MQTILKNIQTIDGVQCIMVGSKSGELKAISGDLGTFNFDAFNIEKLPYLASIINEFQLQEQGVQFSFENLYLDIRIFQKGFLVIVCNPDVDITILNKSLKKTLTPVKGNKIFKN